MVSAKRPSRSVSHGPVRGVTLGPRLFSKELIVRQRSEADAGLHALAGLLVNHPADHERLLRELKVQSHRGRAIGALGVHKAGQVTFTFWTIRGHQKSLAVPGQPRHSIAALSVRLRGDTVVITREGEEGATGHGFACGRVRHHSRNLLAGLEHVGGLRTGQVMEAVQNPQLVVFLLVQYIIVRFRVKTGSGNDIIRRLDHAASGYEEPNDVRRSRRLEE